MVCKLLIINYKNCFGTPLFLNIQDFFNKDIINYWKMKKARKYLKRRCYLIVPFFYKLFVCFIRFYVYLSDIFLFIIENVMKLFELLCWRKIRCHFIWFISFRKFIYKHSFMFVIPIAAINNIWFYKKDMFLKIFYYNISINFVTFFNYKFCCYLDNMHS